MSWRKEDITILRDEIRAYRQQEERIIVPIWGNVVFTFPDGIEEPPVFRHAYVRGEADLYDLWTLQEDVQPDTLDVVYGVYQDLSPENPKLFGMKLGNPEFMQIAERIGHPVMGAIITGADLTPYRS